MPETSQADLMIELAIATGAQLFTDQYSNPYIRYNQSPAIITYSLKSGIVKDWLSSLLWNANAKAPGGEAVNSALSVLRAKAREGPTHHLYTRVAPDGEGGALIDMANESWSHIRVTPNGWSIGNTRCPTFRRYKHMKELPMPTKGGDSFDILQFVNLKEEGHRLLYVITIISYLIPDIQHPVLVFYGPHGSGKSLSLLAARAVVDPSIVGLLALPRQDRELVQQLYHHYCGFYDNVSKLPNWASDVFCRAVTGTGNTKRALYTDDEDVIYEYRRCLGINGINIAAQRGDLLDRSIMLGCEMMDDSARLEEKVLTQLLDSLAPSILGGMLDAVVSAMNIYPTIQLEKLSRMADFTRWGSAIAEALNLDKNLFLEAYEENVKAQSEETLKASLPATVLIAFMDLYPEGIWRGAPSVLYDELTGYAEELKIRTRGKAWPKGASWLMRRLNEVTPSLYTHGYVIEKDRAGNTRVVTIRKTPANSVNGVHAVQGAKKHDGNDGINGTLQSFSMDQNQGKSETAVDVHGDPDPNDGMYGINSTSQSFTKDTKEITNHSEGDPEDPPDQEYQEGLFVDAIRILKEHGDNMLQKVFFEDLVSLGHHQAQTSKILRGDLRFSFRVLTVSLVPSEVENRELQDGEKNEKENLSQSRRKIENVEKSTLQTQLKKVLNVISEMEKIRGSVRGDDLYDELEKTHKIGKREAAKIIGVLLKDGTIYSPRPNYYKETR